MTMDQSMMEKARAAKSAEELLALARTAGMDMTAEQAGELYVKLNPACGELPDDELDNVAGGGCSTDVGGESKVVVTSGCPCFTGQFENALKYLDVQCMGWDLLPGAESRVGGWVFASSDGCCGRCMNLGFKDGGLGYCKVS